MRRARETRTDWYSARAVAMLVAVNSKSRKYLPKKYMMAANLKEAAAAPERRPMSGDEVFAAFQRRGDLIDLAAS